MQATALIPPKGGQPCVYLDFRARGTEAEEKAILNHLLAAAALHGIIPLPRIGSLPRLSLRDEPLTITVGGMVAAEPVEAEIFPVEA